MSKALTATADDKQGPHPLWAKVWISLLGDVEVRACLLSRDYCTPILWDRLILLAKSLKTHGRLLLRNGAPMSAAHLSDAVAIGVDDLMRSMAVLESWKWVVNDGGCWVLPNFDAKQETKWAAWKRKQRTAKAASKASSKMLRKAPRTRSRDQEEEVEVEGCPVDSPVDCPPGSTTTTSKHAINKHVKAGAGDSPVVVQTLPLEDGEHRATRSRASGPERRIVLNVETWTLDGVTDDDVTRLIAEFPLVDVAAAIRDVGEYARVDEDYRRHDNWAKTLRSRCRDLQREAEARPCARDHTKPRRQHARVTPVASSPASTSCRMPELTPPTVDWQCVVAVVEARAGNGAGKWLKSLEYIGDRGDVVEVAAADLFSSDWVNDNYSESIRDALLEVTGRQLSIRMVVAKDISHAETDRC